MRIRVLIVLGVTLLGLGFAPAPIYKAPPKAKTVDLLTQMQGRWNMSITTGGPIKGKKGGLTGRQVLIEGAKWSYVSPNGQSVTTPYDIKVDTTKTPVTMDIRYTALNRNLMQGIIQLEGDEITFCYVSGAGGMDERPASFTDQQVPSGRRVMMMKLTRVK